jgi:predicted DNA-binding transcriptional regulator
VGEDKIEFILSKFMKTPVVEDTCYALDIIDECVKEIEKELPQEMEILKPPISDDQASRQLYVDDSLSEHPPLATSATPELKQSSLELNPLPKNLRYEYLDKYLNRHVIVNADLNPIETEKLLDVLRKYPSALGYNISDLKGISPSVCMHQILLEEDAKTSREHQRRINPILSEVVRKEVLKLLEAGIIYQIYDSKWVSLVHVVPKKGGLTVVQNEKGEAVSKS